MTVLVVANDVIPGFGVPVAAPGIRSAGLVEGLRAAGFDVEVVVPETILSRVWTRPTPPSPPPGVTILEPPMLDEFIRGRGYSDVVFTNANMSPHLRPVAGTRFIFDLFAPKVLELLSSDRPEKDWVRLAQRKERAFALADHVWVNGKRKLGYALGWLLRPSVDRIRTEVLGLDRLITGDPMHHISLVEMGVPLPTGIDVRTSEHARGETLRVGIGGYAQSWSVRADRPAGPEIALELGHEVHVLAPRHWGGADPLGPAEFPPEVVRHDGPIGYPEFARWLQSMDVVIDAFPQTTERHLAMITRSAVALRFGVPVVHGVDSEISDLIREYDAGWVVESDDTGRWRAALEEAADPAVLTSKQSGANELSRERLAPDAALAEAADRLRRR